MVLAIALGVADGRLGTVFKYLQTEDGKTAIDANKSEASVVKATEPSVQGAPEDQGPPTGALEK